MSLRNEQELIARLADGDATAFAELYRQHGPVICRYILKFLKSTPLAEDLTQEIFSQIWESHSMLGDIRSFRAYLFRLSRNAALNFLRRAAVDATAKGIIMQSYRTKDNCTEDHFVTADYMAYLEKLLQTLTPQSREVFRLCRTEYKTYEEAAAILGISRNAVKKHMVKTMRMLGERVERDLGISPDLGISLAVLIICTSLPVAMQAAIMH
ncbi:sigma-70 family RNA polymerase sigma factor [Parapedobacter defluvii]|uniref:RNA polymerase sigma factor n=1 Tax=Parapedobacter defluvii TaxID=2045106 RepID=UPI0033409369